MYQVGDRVVHPMHGAGIIESIVQERLGGQLGSYYVFRMPSGGLTLKIPTGSCGAIGVRALSTSGRIREVLSAIPGLEIDRTTNWNRRYRENLNRLKSGDLLEVARVIKGLMWRDREKGLSNGERKMLHSAKQILVSEVVLVEGHTYPDVEQRIQAVNACMETYLAENRFRSVPDSLVYVERTQSDGRIRHGIVGRIDLAMMTGAKNE